MGGSTVGPTHSGACSSVPKRHILDIGDFMFSLFRYLNFLNYLSIHHGRNGHG
jgi:hypothetical protein